jgi:Na+/proline symporter
MPIGWLLGLSIALIWCGIGLRNSNRLENDHKYMEWSRIVRQIFRAAALIMIYVGTFTFIGTLIELYV